MSDLSGRGYVVRLVGAMVSYAIVLTASLVALDNLSDQPWRAVVALSPIIPMAYIVWLVVARFRTLDEYWQHVQLTALPFAFLGSVFVAFTWGFVENAGFAPPSGFVFFGIMNGLYLVGLWLARRRYS